MFEEADHFADIFRGGLPYYFLLPLIIIICSSNPVLAASEFTVQRLTQFDVNGVAYGCRASALSLEAKSLYTWSTGRHCVVAKLQDMTIDQFREIRQKAGGLVILLPQDIASMKAEEKEHLNLLEQAMLAQPSSIPVYFSSYNTDLEQIIADITRTSISNSAQSGNEKVQLQRRSALGELFASISANGYQVIVSGATHAASKQSRIPVIQGELAPAKYMKQVDGAMDVSSKLPLIIITAHLNTFGLYNEYPFNADAAIMMTVAELFSKMHNTATTAPKYRLMFLLSESGALLNFQGAKKWLDENMQLQNVDFVLCLDTVAPALNSDASDALYMHVSKPPKDGTAMNNFYQLLKNVGGLYDNVTVEGVHKKINLADQQLAWEHERFSMRRLPAFTLSALKSSKEPVRTTIFKDADAELLQQTLRKATVIAEALARYVYNIEEDGEIFAGAIQINKNLVRSYLNLRSALHNNDLKNAFEKYLKNVKIVYDKPDAREPDFMLYDGQEANLNVYRVKPAVFDLFLTLLICAYLAAVYLIIQYFPRIYDVVCRLSKTSSAGVANSANIYAANANNHSERMKAKLN